MAVRCDCGDWIVIGESKGPTDSPNLPEKLHLTCEVCGKASSYPRNTVRHSHVTNSRSAPPTERMP